jgi:integrase
MRVDHWVDHNINHFTFTKRGFYYFSRRVPKDIQSEYRKKRIVIALKTRCQDTAMNLSFSISNRLNKLWMDMRFKEDAIPAAHLLLSHDQNEVGIPAFSEAYALYLKMKGQDKSKTFYQSCERIVSQFIKSAGDNALDRYSRSDANSLRDKLLKNGLAPQSVKRLFSILRTIFNLAINEHSLSCPNIFTRVEFGDVKPVIKRLPVPIEDIKRTQSKCEQLDDPNRWLVALISDTGMRLSEALGLSINDIVLDHETPYVNIIEHDWRPLKTPSSIRKVPLVGSSLWAAQRIVTNATTDKAFPKYTNDKECKSNSASGALNKWLRPHLPKHCVIHSFRHSIRDRLRAVQCPSDIVDQIGGWSGNASVGQGYGQGYPLSVLTEWLEKISMS